ncbi:GAF domain-containing protein [Paraburkholderia sediminicola]|uniref:GAF domain-containing protein n=1 Tax=Paraburkholderia sediminicola TaxID=458836 RepID=UPI0038BD5E3E
MHTAIQHRVIGAFSQQLQNELFEPGLIWPALDEAMKQALGHIIFSVLAYDRDGQRMVRLYSNHPDRIPVGGIKSVTDSEWTRRVLMEGTLFVNSNEGDIRRVFPDHERILSFRCASALNIPVKLGGVVVGSINLLDRQEFYDYIDPDVAWTFAQLIAPVLAEAVRSLPPGTAEAGSVERV